MNTVNQNALPGEALEGPLPCTGEEGEDGNEDILASVKGGSRDMAGPENEENTLALRNDNDDDGNDHDEDYNPQSTLEILRNVTEMMVSVPINFILGKAEKPRRYLYDRCNGSSQYRDNHRPPCPLFYVPFPVKWFPDLLEQNAVCERFGRIGCVRPYDNRMRKVIFALATLCQLISFGLTFYAAFAMSKSYKMLPYTSFTHGMGSIVGGRTGKASPGLAVEIEIGLLGIAMVDPRNLSGFSGQVISWDEFCIEVTEGFQDSFKVPICQDCGSQSRSLVASMIMSLLFSIPTFMTDILRFYPDYDVSQGLCLPPVYKHCWAGYPVFLLSSRRLGFFMCVLGQLSKILWCCRKFYQYDF